MGKVATVRGSLVAKLMSFSMLLCLLSGQTAAAIETVIEYPIPDHATGLTEGPDGNVWFTEGNSNTVAKITPAGVVTEYLLPTPSSYPTSITTGPDGNLWFTQSSVNQIGKITPSGTVTEYAVPTAFSGYETLITGPDGNLWFTNGPDNISKMTTAGVITEYAVPGLFPTDITVGPDGNLWFIDFNAAQIVAITTQGIVVATHPGDSNWEHLIFGSDGNLWITGGGDNTIVKMTLSGVTTEYPVPTSGAYPRDIAAGPDGNLWFTEFLVDTVGKITTDGVITEYAIPLSSPSNSSFITSGPDGTMWFDINGSMMGVVQGLTILPSGSGSSGGSPSQNGSGSNTAALQAPDTGYARAGSDPTLFMLIGISAISSIAALIYYRRDRRLHPEAPGRS